MLLRDCVQLKKFCLRIFGVLNSMTSPRALFTCSFHIPKIDICLLPNWANLTCTARVYLSLLRAYLSLVSRLSIPSSVVTRYKVCCWTLNPRFASVGQSPILGKVVFRNLRHVVHPALLVLFRRRHQKATCPSISCHE